MPSYNDYLSYLRLAPVQAFLDTIAWAEGANYNTLFGGSTFNDYSRHPNRAIRAGGYTSTAAGRYQFLFSTWAGIANKLGLPDFSPRSQDIAALELINQRGALSYVLNGDIIRALKTLGCAWASLPFSGCGQGERTVDAVVNYYNNAGGGSSYSDTGDDLTPVTFTDNTSDDNTIIYIMLGLLAVVLLTRE